MRSKICAKVFDIEIGRKLLIEFDGLFKSFIIGTMCVILKSFGMIEN